MLVILDPLRQGIPLAWGACVDSVECADEAHIHSGRIHLDETERIPWLRVDIDTHHVEPGFVVACCRAAFTAE
jgi:hypothetical protein